MPTWEASGQPSPDSVAINCASVQSTGVAFGLTIVPRGRSPVTVRGWPAPVSTFPSLSTGKPSSTASS
jgi:hypothetical protein